ncbi:MAG: CHAT domain-containing protein, partial [bacterium]
TLINKWEEAIASQQILNEIYKEQGDLLSLENGERNLSVYFSNQRATAEAILHRARAEQMAVERDAEAEAAQDEQILAMLFEKSGDHDNSEKSIAQARSRFEQVGNVPSVVACGIFQARLAFSRENHSRAAEILTQLQSAVLFTDSTAKDQTLLPAEFYQHLGLAYEGMFSLEAAQQAQNKALEIAGDSVSVVSATCHQYLAHVHWKRGDFRQALRELQVAKEQFASLDLKEYLYLAENAEALIYLQRGDFTLAEDRIRSALEGAIRANDEISRSKIEKNYGLILLTADKSDKAIRHFQKAISLDEKPGGDLGRAYSYIDLGNAFLQAEQLDSALVAFATAHQICSRIGNAAGISYSLLGFGQVELKRGNSKNALEYLLQARGICQQRSLQNLCWRIQLWLARCESQRGNLEEALKSLEEAIASLEELHGSTAIADLRSQILDNEMDVYRLAVSLNIELENVDFAFDAAERARAHVFSKLRRAGILEEGIGLDPSTEHELKELEDRISGILFKLEQVQAQEVEHLPVDQVSTQILVELKELREAHDKAMDRAEQEHSGYKDFFSPQVRSAKQICDLLQENEAMIEYYESADGMVAFVLNAAGVKVQKLSIDSQVLEEQVFALRSKLEKKLTYQQECRYLYEVLFEPLETLIADCQNLIIIPYSSLHYVPFAIFQDNEKRFLLDRFTISYAPSANVFAFCRIRAQSQVQWDKTPFLALGNPASASSYEDLFYTEKELFSIRMAFPNSRIQFGSEATEEALFADGNLYGAVHLACHGAYDSSDPLSTRITLAPSRETDGELMVSEVFNLQLERCGLITLSACESGFPTLSEGNELVSLNRAFIYAGSPRVLSTLWKIDDFATAVLCKRFYRYLASGDDPALALKKAQQLVRDHVQSHPFFWAATILTGEPTLKP